MSTHSTRCPSSAKAAARFSVVVVLATPPFWLANAMTLALPCTGGSDARLLESRCPVGIRMAMRDSCMRTRSRSPDPMRTTIPRMRAGDSLRRARPAGTPEGKRVVICVGAGGVGKTTISAALALGLAMRGQQGGGRDDRPGQASGHRARAGRARGRAASDRPGAAARAGRANEGRAVGDDARRQAHVR